MEETGVETNLLESISKVLPSSKLEDLRRALNSHLAYSEQLDRIRAYYHRLFFEIKTSERKKLIPRLSKKWAGINFVKQIMQGKENPNFALRNLFSPENFSRLTQLDSYLAKAIHDPSINLDETETLITLYRVVKEEPLQAYAMLTENRSQRFIGLERELSAANDQPLIEKLYAFARSMQKTKGYLSQKIAFLNGFLLKTEVWDKNIQVGDIHSLQLRFDSIRFNIQQFINHLRGKMMQEKEFAENLERLEPLKQVTLYPQLLQKLQQWFFQIRKGQQQGDWGEFYEFYNSLGKSTPVGELGYKDLEQKFLTKKEEIKEFPPGWEKFIKDSLGELGSIKTLQGIIIQAHNTMVERIKQRIREINEISKEEMDSLQPLRKAVAEKLARLTERYGEVKKSLTSFERELWKDIGKVKEEFSKMEKSHIPVALALKGLLKEYKGAVLASYLSEASATVPRKNALKVAAKARIPDLKSNPSINIRRQFSALQALTESSTFLEKYEDQLGSLDERIAEHLHTFAIDWEKIKRGILEFRTSVEGIIAFLTANEFAISQEGERMRDGPLSGSLSSGVK